MCSNATHPGTKLVSIPSSITLLMSGHCDCLPLTTNHCETLIRAASMLLLTLLNSFQHCIFTVTLVLLQLQHMQLKNIKNTNVFSLMHMSPSLWRLLSSALPLKNSCYSWLCTVPPSILLTMHCAPQHLTATSICNYYYRILNAPIDTDPSCYSLLWGLVAWYWSMRWTPQRTLPKSIAP